ncbi:ESPR-type extended signal peptide-containing protein, partial [Psychrobacter sp. NPDC078409]|uniref:ESPR domain-containing protein n=1 Tax=Psychrobacter sp. NPDC078409 TaxID=3390660 RepID=UPI003D092AF4
MNRNYKVIWNRSLGCFMAVAEYAKSRGKSSSSAVSSNSSASAAVSTGARLLRLSSLTVALAATGLTLSTQAFAVAGAAGGSSSQASSTAISPLALDCGPLGEAAIIGVGVAAVPGVSPTIPAPTNSIAIGCGTTINNANDSVAIGRENTVSATNGLQQQIGDRRLGGVRNYATGETFYIGTAVALGDSNSTAAGGGVALGNSNQVTGGSHGIAIGQGNVTSEAFGVGLGVGNLSTGNTAIAIGTANESTGNTSIALGRQTYSRADFGIAAGNIATVEAGATNGIALGTSSNVAAAGVNSVAIGANTAANAANSVALGQGSVANAQTGNSYLTNVAATTDGTVSVGSDTIKRRITNLADGSAASDAVTVAQLQSSVSAGSAGNTTRSEGNMTALGGSYDAATDTYTPPEYVLDNSTTTVNTVGEALGNLDSRTTNNTTAIASGLNFAGDSGTNVNRPLGSILNITGGETDPANLTTGNIGVVADGTDELSIQLAEAIDLGEDGSLTTGDTVVNNAGVAIDDGADNVTT